jgi:hypothetical protein
VIARFEAALGSLHMQTVVMPQRIHLERPQALSALMEMRWSAPPLAVKRVAFWI